MNRTALTGIQHGSVPCVLLALLFMVFQPLQQHAMESGISHARTLLANSGFFENDEARRTQMQSIEAPSYQSVTTQFSIIRQITNGRIVQFELRKALTSWYLIFRNQRGSEPRDQYPLWGRGTWIIRRSLLDGSYEQAKIFIQDDEESYIRLLPMPGRRSRLDLYLYGRRLADDIILPMDFGELVLSPLAQIIALSEHSIDWNTIFPDTDNKAWQNIANLVSTLRIYSDYIQEVPDSAINASGQNVYIETGLPVPPQAPLSRTGTLKQGNTGLNCSGYVKWVADAIYSAWHGTPGQRYLDINQLRTPTPRSKRNSWNEARSALGEQARQDLELVLRDPWFGLDWNRNLAKNLEQARMGRPLTQTELADLETSYTRNIPYKPDLGYTLDDLPAALYQLAATQPGYIYLAAINSRFVPPQTSNAIDPYPLHQYWHVSILAPWFENGSTNTEQGTFRVAVLDTGQVTESFLPTPGTTKKPLFIEEITANATRYAALGLDADRKPHTPDIMVHLIRIKVPNNIIPVPLPTL